MRSFILNYFLFAVFILPSSIHAQQANNDCANAISLTPGSTCVGTSGSTTGNTQSVAAINCNGATGDAGDDGWYSFVATSSQHTIIVNGANNYDAVVDVRQGACNGTTILCQDATVGGGTEYVYWNGFVVGTTYYIRTYDYAGGSSTNAQGAGSFTICVTAPSCSDGILNGNETDVDCGGSCSACANYYQPSAGTAGEYVGACVVNTCSGTFTDYGGASGNYPSNDNNYRVFCPNSAGMCMRAAFTSFNVNDLSIACFNSYGTGTFCCDEFWITNNSTQNGTLLWGGCGTTGPGTVTSTDASGCLSFRFFSDGTVTTAGWSATLSCVSCTGGPAAGTNADCATPTAVCANTSISSNAVGPGLVSDACGGGACPAGGENHSNWFLIQISTSGTLGFTIVPTTATDDYDFTLYGPNVSCGSLGNPLRCSDASATGNTGLNSTSVDVSENVSGDKFCSMINATAGQTYYLMVDEWSTTGGGYSLNWSGTAGLDCVVLPVDLLSFDVRYNTVEDRVDIDWATLIEKDNDFFSVEKSIDGVNFKEIAIVDGQGNSSEKVTYNTADFSPVYREINYYRIKQVDFNGKFRYSDIKAVVIERSSSMFNIAPNPAGSIVHLSYNTALKTKWNINVYNALGQLMWESTSVSVEGHNKETIDISELPQGIYYVQMVSGENAYKGRFVKE